MNNPWLIAGGGISGLSAAIALHKSGFPAKLVESYPEAKPAGAGIILAPNALEALRRLDPELPKQARELGFPCSEMRILSERGEVLTRSSAGASFGSSYAMTRAELYKLLLDAVPSDIITYGRRAVHISSSSSHSADGLLLTLDDGAAWEGTAVLACDGIHSKLRQQQAPSILPRYVGYTCWRGLVKMDIQQTYFSETWGLKGRFGVVPLRGGRVYWYALINAPWQDPLAGAYRKEDLKKLFSEFHAPIPQILDRLLAGEWLHSDIMDIAPMPQFAFGRLLLMGDAAHAMTPNLGQGACQALEDSAVLAECLREGDPPMEIFKRYERRRKGRVQQMAAASLRMGRVAQLDQPLLCRLRNLAMRWMPESVGIRQMQKLYHMP